MPTYDYVCDNCGFESEEFRMISKRNDPKECPKCKGNMSKLIGKGSGMILRGEGFYETDYKKESEFCDKDFS